MKTELRNVWQFLHVQGIVTYNLLSILNSTVLISIPLVLGCFIDALVCRGDATSYFLLLVGAALFNLLMNTLLKGSAYRMARMQEQTLQIRLLNTFRIMKPAAIDDGYRNGEIAMKFFRDTGSVGNFISNVYPQMLNTVTGSLLALIAVLYKNPPIALIVIAFISLTVVELCPYRKRFARFNHSIRKIYDKSMNGIFEFMRIFPGLKSLGADQPYVDAPRYMFVRCRMVRSLNDRVEVWYEFVNRAVVFIGEYGVLGVAGWFAWKRMISVGDVVVFQVLFLSVLNSVSSLFQVVPSLEMTLESMRSMNELFFCGQTEDIVSGNRELRISGTISVRNVSFSYATSSRRIFSDFSCDIECGHIVALSGSNGTGKTTLLKLILGYLEPCCGSIEVAGVDLSAWQKKAFRERIAAVFQDELIFTGTIRDNITLKNRMYTNKEIEEAVRLSGAESLIDRMPDGLEHRIGVEGGGLSGGERQKVAIARALIRKPDILVFDEVTNHLDYESRCRMKDLLNTLRGRATVLMVSHDPEMLALCDKVIDLPGPMD